MVASGDIIYASDHAPIYGGESLRNSGSIVASGGTEIVAQSFTFPAVTGVRYKITCLQHVESTIANDALAVKVRWAVGNTATITSTFLNAASSTSPVSRGVPVVVTTSFVSTTTGNVTVVACVRRTAGTGTLSSVGGAEQINTILIERYQ